MFYQVKKLMVPTEKLKNIGEAFKLKRKEMNVSLKEAENATSIRMSYLQSIEEGDVHKLISPVYAQGFVKQYAIFLGIDGEKIVKEHPELFCRPESQEFSYGIGTLEVRGNPGAGIKWFPNAIWIILSILIVIAAWYTARFFEII